MEHQFPLSGEYPGGQDLMECVQAYLFSHREVNVFGQGYHCQAYHCRLTGCLPVQINGSLYRAFNLLP